MGDATKRLRFQATPSWALQASIAKDCNPLPLPPSHPARVPPSQQPLRAQRPDNGVVAARKEADRAKQSVEENSKLPPLPQKYPKTGGGGEE